MLIFLPLFAVMHNIRSSLSDLISEDYILSHYTEDLVGTMSNHSKDTTLRVKLASQIKDLKLLQYYQRVKKLQSSVEERLSRQPQIEGNSVMLLRKVKIIANHADDKRVKNICEIGFNMGHSTLNYLVHNPEAKILIFDLFQHEYSVHALESLRSMFPNRIMVAITGDSSLSVPSFVKMFLKSGFCNLIFIDGGHKADELRSDLTNMRHLADPGYNRVIVDDVEYAHLARVWEEAIESQVLSLVENHEDIMFTPNLSTQLRLAGDDPDNLIGLDILTIEPDGEYFLSFKRQGQPDLLQSARVVVAEYLPSSSLLSSDLL
jgi:hypothetical protein